MKKIMIISDTHQNQVLLRHAFSLEDQITHIFHLGDFYEDLDNNLDLTENKEVVKVPGIFHPGFQDGSIEPVKTLSICGWNFLLIHNFLDPRASSKKYNIVFHGHTHQADFRKIDQNYYINPGHLKANSDRGRKASYLVLEVYQNELIFKFHHLDGKMFFLNSIQRGIYGRNDDN